MKYNKPALNVNEQIKLLKSRGNKIIVEKTENIEFMHRLDSFLSRMNTCKINSDEELFNNYKKSASTILDILK